MAIKRVQNPGESETAIRAIPMCWCCCCGRGKKDDKELLETVANLLSDQAKALRQEARSLEGKK